MTAVKLVIAITAEVRDGEVAPESSGEGDLVVADALGRVRVSRAIWPSDLWSVSKMVGTSSVSGVATATPTFMRL